MDMISHFNYMYVAYFVVELVGMLDSCKIVP